MKREGKVGKVVKILCSLMMFAVISGTDWMDAVWAAEIKTEGEADVVWAAEIKTEGEADAVWAAEEKTEGQADIEITNVWVNTDNFPNVSFRNYVSENFDTNKDNILSREEIEKVKIIDISSSGINNLTGIEYFPFLEKLDCSDCSLPNLDISKNTALISLYCSYNWLSNLDLSKNTALTELDCHNNWLNGLDLSKNTALTYLNCHYNQQLTSLDLSNNVELTELDCSSTPFTRLDLSKNTKLVKLNCSSTHFTSLDLSKNTALTELDCGSGALKNLDISKNTALTKLDCSCIRLNSLDLSKNTELTYLNCRFNSLSSLDLSKNTALTYLNCNINQLSSLDVSKNIELTYLDCSSTQLTSLDVSRNTALTYLDCSYNQLSSLDVSKNTELNYLGCHYNQLTSLDIRDHDTSRFNFYCHGNPLKMLLLNKTNSVISKRELLYDLAITNLSNLSNIEIDNSTVTILDKNKPASYIYPYYYKDGDKDAVKNLLITIYCMEPEEISPSLPDLGKPSPTPEVPTPTPELSPTPEAPTPTPEPSPIPAHCTHLFFDYQYSSPVSGAAIVVYGNGGTLKNPDGTKINTKLFTAYTNITPSYQFTVKQSKVKATSGKVIAGLTLSEEKPTLQKGKIVDTEAAKIAKASVKNGVVTVTATGKGGGIVYLWIMDTGSLGAYESCPVEVKLLPTKLKVQNTSGSEVKNLSLAVGNSSSVYVAGMVGTVKAEDGTYTATVDAKSKDYIEVTKGDAPGQFKITALKQNSKAKTTKATVTFTCDQNGKKIKLAVTITK